MKKMKDIDDSSSLSQVEDSKKISADIYENSIKNDELEASQRSEIEDQEMFNQVCKQIKVLMKEILKLKVEKPEHWVSDLDGKKMKVLMLTLSLRKLSRIQKVRVKCEREKTSENRQNVDAATLQLQNLLYEVSHLKKEVRKCLEFQAADREIDLVPIKQFYKDAPTNISRKEETMNNPHQQHLAQLHWELEQRQGQTQLFDKLTYERDTISAIIDDQETKISSLKPRINSILDATKPLQKALDLPMDETKEQQSISQFLPAPLYTLWVQVTAYGEACDNSLKCEIEGDAEAARELTIPVDVETEASDSEGEIELELPEDVRKKKSRTERKNRDSQEREDVNRLLVAHPLYLVLKIRAKDNNTVVVKFQYANILRIVTVFCSLELKDSSITHSPLLTDILSGDKFLNQLFPGDLGTESPNPANEFHFQKLNVPSLLSDHLSVLGKPYRWAQTLSGLSFLACESEQETLERQESFVFDDLDTDESSQEIPVCPQPKVMRIPPKVTESLSWKMSAEHVHHVVSSIKRRLQARLALSIQLALLENAGSTSDIPVSSECLLQHFPGKVTSELRSWKPITFQDYEANSSTQTLLKRGLISKDFLTFKAIFDRKSVSMEALVAISPDYPNEQPLFSLTLLWGEEKQIGATNPHVRQMESEVNVYWPELVVNRSDRFQVVSLQLYRIAMCFDILTEATSTHVSSDQLFHKEKIFFRPARGPDRSLPLKYLPKLGVFAQR